jgi:hypothetical protein
VSKDPLPGLDDHSLLLRRIRKQLVRWAARYAATPHAKNDVKETNLLIQEIDEYLLRQ